MTGQFQNLMTELGRYFHLELRVDQSGACSLLFPHQIVIQLQLDTGGEKLFFFCKIAEIPPGKFRENVLIESLKANDMRDPIPGILAYLNVTNHLVLYHSYPLFILNGERLSMFIINFLQMADAWRKAILSGKSSPAPSSISSSSSLPNPFGLKP